MTANIPGDYIDNVGEEFKNIPFFILKAGCKNNLDKHIHDYKDLQELSKLLKLKMIMINKNIEIALDNSYEFFINLLITLRNLETFEPDILKHLLLIQSSNKMLEHLIEYSIQNLENWKSRSDTSIIFFLDVLQVVIETCVLQNCKSSNVNKIHSIILQLIQSENKLVQKKLTTQIITEYYECTKSDAIFSDIWNGLNEIAKLNILCALAPFFIPRKTFNSQYSVVNEPDFWALVQNNLISKDQLLKKRSLFLMKHVNNVVFNNEYYSNIFMSPAAPEVLKWNASNKNDIKQAWEKLLLLCDISNEKQLHLVTPNLKFYKLLNPLHVSWRRCVSHLFLGHAHTAVITKAVQLVLLSEWECEISHVASALNNTKLFKNPQKIRTLIQTYLSKLNENELVLFIHSLCACKYNYISLYYIIEEIKTFKLSKPNFDLIKKLLNACNNLAHVFIRTSIQYSITDFLFKTPLTNTSYTQPEFSKLLNILLVIYKHINGSDLQLWMVDRELCATAINDYISNVVQNKTRYNYEINLVLHWLISKLQINKLIKSNLMVTDEFTDSKVAAVMCYLTALTPTNSDNLDLETITKLFNYFCVSSIDEEQICYYVKSVLHSFETAIHNDYILYPLCAFSLQFKKSCKFATYITIFETILEYIFTFWTQNEDNTLNVKHHYITVDQIINCANNFKKSEEYSVREHEFKQSVYLLHQRAHLLKQYLTVRNSMCPIQTEYITTFVNETCDQFDKFNDDLLYIFLKIVKVVVEKNLFQDISMKKFLQSCYKKIVVFKTHDKQIIYEYLLVVFHENVLNRLTLEEFVKNLIDRIIKNKEYNPVILLYMLRLYDVNQGLSPDRISSLWMEALFFGIANTDQDRIEFKTCISIQQEKNLKKENPIAIIRAIRESAVSIFSSIKKPDVCHNIRTTLQHEYKQYFGKRYFRNSDIHIKKLRIIQAMNLIQFNSDDNNDFIKWLLECLLNENNEPSVSYLIQLLIIQQVKNNEEHFMLYLLDEYIDRFGDKTSIIQIIYHIVSCTSLKQSIVIRIVNYLLPHTMGKHFQTRFCAQLTIKMILENHKSYMFNALLLPALSKVIEQTESIKEKTFFLTHFNIKHHVNLSALFTEIPRLTNVMQSEWLFNLPGEQYLRFIHDNEQLISICTEASDDESDGDCDDFQYNKSMNIQKKIEPLQRNDLGKPKRNIVLVASLIDRPPNLGGLSRTCEVFGVSEYVLNNIHTMHNKDYKNISMSSENWVKTSEVKMADLPEYIKTMRKDGFHIIGAEQTDNSHGLHEFKFKQKSVVILGNEKEGIPPNLLDLLDACIEIPQSGQIRSLNVHVAGAIILWEYYKQHEI